MTEPATDMAALFAKDPLELTKADLQVIIGEYRKARVNFNQGVRAAGSTKKVVGEKKPKVEKATQIDLDDLL